MKYHILNGDCLAGQLSRTSIRGESIVCRECLIEGDLGANNSSDFWVIRAKFIADSYNTSTEDYFNRTVHEFGKLQTLPDNSEVCLWFENDLFCQTNMWFVISLLGDQPTLKLYRIFPTINNIADNWKGFGISNTEMLEQSYASRIPFDQRDIDLGIKLWTAYKNNNFTKLKELSNTQSKCFQYLQEVCQAHIDRFPTDDVLGRPEKAVKNIIETKSTNFHDVFSEFSIQQGIYGFGDLQIKQIYDKQMRRH